ncbi:MAG: hypothetical protein WAW73_22205 [Rhodoferax sp.]
MRNRLPRILASAACILGLMACTQGTRHVPGNAPPPPNLLTQESPTGVRTLRVIVQFKQSAAFADAAFVQSLQDQIQAPVHYLSAVSADTHVYQLQVAPDQNPATVVQRLAALPNVARVERDAAAKSH